MNQHDTEALEFWQSSQEGLLDRQVYDLDVLIDDMLTGALTREGYRYLKSRRLKLQSIARKLELLVQDLQPETVTQWPIKETIT